MRRVGVDPGTRRVGLAWCEGEPAVATPHKTLQIRDQAGGALAVVEELASLEAQEVVVGLPLRLDGSEGEAARRARRFAALIQQASGLPVVLWDERLSTSAAHQSLRQAGVGGRRGRQLVDQMAAALLLQSYLDANSQS